MANNSRVNPFYVDSTGGLVNPLTELTVTGIMILPSNATWAITIKDGAGNTKFFANNTGAGACIPPRYFSSTGLEVTTLTNATALIYVQ
jgi:hypothetical protein